VDHKDMRRTAATALRKLIARCSDGRSSAASSEIGRANMIAHACLSFSSSSPSPQRVKRGGGGGVQPSYVDVLIQRAAKPSHFSRFPRRCRCRRRLVIIASTATWVVTASSCSRDARHTNQQIPVIVSRLQAGGGRDD